MNELVEIGKPPWSRQDMIDSLQEFEKLWRDRPIINNRGGMLSVPMFLMWFVLQKLQPKIVIESGVFRGLGTWFIEKACPRSDLYCIDINYRPLQYRSPKAVYFDTDFSVIQWSNYIKNFNDVLVFFDDHCNDFGRIELCKNLGIKHLIFEDNYPLGEGDVYSLKKAFRLGIRDAQYLYDNLKIYQELPPIFQVSKWRGCDWDFPTSEPLLKTLKAEWQQVFLDEAREYTFMCYCELK